jgi:hypothetical protein
MNNASVTPNMRYRIQVLISILLLNFFPALSQQQLNKPEALNYASKLDEYSLLNKKGKDELEKLVPKECWIQ